MLSGQTNTWMCSLLVLVGLAGCKQTYYSMRVTDHSCPFRGVPANVHRPYYANVTWSKLDGKGNNIVTRHSCVLPVLYGVDVQKSPFGTTKAAFEFNDSGQLTKSNAEVDQQVDEILSSVAEILDASNPGQARGTTSTAFNPDLDEMKGEDKLGWPIDIQFMEIL